MEKTIISYSLCGEKTNSDRYYEVVEDIAQEIKRFLIKKFGSEITAYQKFIKDHQIEEMRTQTEYGLELLMLGVLWRCYGQAAWKLGSVQGSFLKWVAQQRKKSKKIKPFWSRLKGRLSTRYLVYKDQDKTCPRACSLALLMRWLKATGEYDEEAKRLEGWAQYLKGYSREQREQLRERLIRFAEEFEVRTAQKLLPYVKGVESFRSEKGKIYENREDQIFCMQPVSLYYLNMVGAAILNEAYREEFARTKECVIFLPGCMTYRGRAGCQAKPTRGGYICQGCSIDCPVREVSELSQQLSAQTIILYHESELNGQKVDKDRGKVGVIGVACVLNLISGGFKAKRLGYVPQCVLLDYCGCMQHWDENGIITGLNEQKLLETLEQRRSGSRYLKATGQ